MNRRQLLRSTATLAACGIAAPRLFSSTMTELFTELKKSDFGKNFRWGAANAAYQVEGAWNTDGKGPSIWDTFTHRPGRIHNNDHGDTATDFYHRYAEDIRLVKSLNMDVLRFSISWPRVLPSGTGTVNMKGIDYYNRVIDTCLENAVEPWITLYHWDLPQALEDKGGWANRDITGWFGEYVELMAKTFGDRVKNWMVFNEPMAFTGLGYLAGLHAPGKKSLAGFRKAVHHVVLCQAEGGRILREFVPGGNIGTTFSVSPVHPKSPARKHLNAAKRMDALFNRLFIEPALGMGYPTDDFKFLETIEDQMLPGDAEKMKFDFDFVGVQNYFRIVARQSLFPPVMWANQVKPEKLVNDPSDLTEMGWEVYPQGIYEVLKRFAAYPDIPKIYVTENGAAFPDTVQDGRVHDPRRITYYQQYLKAVLKAKDEGAPVEGYFAWSLTDNFEWAEGYAPRFGLIYVDYATQQRIIKDSGLWFKEFLAEKK